MSPLGPGCVKTQVRGDSIEQNAMRRSLRLAAQLFASLLSRAMESDSTSKRHGWVFTQPGSTTEVELSDADFRFTPQRRHTAVWPLRPLGTNTALMPLACDW